MKELPNLIRIRNAEPGQLPFEKSTIYKLHCLKQYPELIYKVPNMGLVFDLGVWTRMCEDARTASVERATQELTTKR